MNHLLKKGFFALLLLLHVAAGAQTLTGTYTLPGTVNGQNIDNLTKLAALLGNAANPVSGNVVFEFGPTYNAGAEVFPITFKPLSGTGTVTIRPTASASPLVTSGTTTTGALVYLDSVQRLTFDGRPGGTGSTIGWTFRNASTTQPTFHFNVADYDTLRYLQIEGQTVGSTNGVVYFGSSNHYNVLQRSNITSVNGSSSGPLNCIYAYDLASGISSSNHSNSILNNNISQFTPTLTGAASGITIQYTGAASAAPWGYWTISGNSFYRSGSESGAGGYEVIRFLSAGSYGGSIGNLITNNYIGGNAPNFNGTFTTLATGEGAFTGILLDDITASVVSNNSIQNIQLTSTSGASAYGIHIAAGNTNDTLSGNNIGHIQSSAQWGIVGIMNEANNANLFPYIHDNTIHDLVNTNGINVAAKTVGIYAETGANYIADNTIYNLVSATGTGTSGTINTDAAAAGIVINSVFSNAFQRVLNNTVYNISSSVSSNTAVRLYGISVTGPSTSTVHYLAGNNVYNIYGTTSNGNTSLTALKIRGGYYRVYNNVVSLGNRNDGSTITAASSITGIIDSSTGSNTLLMNVWHNSVYIGGTGITGSGNSYAFRRVQSSTNQNNNEDVRNNIFVNVRSNGTGTGKHYGIHLDRVTNVTSDYNLVYGTGTGFVPFHTAGTDYATFFDWRGATSQDVNSLPANPLFNAPNAATPDLHIPSNSSADMMGTSIAGVVYDRDSLLRSSYTPNDIGAYVACGGSLAPTVTLAESANNICSGTSVTFTATPSAGASAGNYEFIRNGVSVQNGTSASYTTTTLANNDSVRVIYNTTASCVSATPASSNTITMTVSPSVTPTVILSVSQNNVCPGTSITFTAQATNGGAAPTFNFIRNGVSVQNGAGNTYTSGTFSNGDSVRVVLTSNAACTVTPTSTVPGIIVVIKPNAISTITQTICFGDSYLGYTTTGIHRDTFPAANGCDSIRTLNLTVRPQNLVTITQSICQGQSFEGYTATGVYRDTMMDANSCDSIRILDLTVSGVINTTVNQTVCFGDSYLGYNNTGTYRDTFQTSGGCDSMRTLNLTVRPQIITNHTYTTCLGNPYQGYAATGVYTDTFTAANGCDSIRILDLTVNDYVRYTEVVTICAGNNFFGYTQTGIYHDTLPPDPGPGCERILTIDLTVRPPVTHTMSQTICPGQSYEGYSVAGTYTDTFTVMPGSCDSIRILTLTVSNLITSSETVTICQGDSYQGYTQTGTYNDTLMASGGCDSIHTLTLAVEPTPVAPPINGADNILSVPDTFDGYQWYLDGNLLAGEESDTLAATADGDYTVVVANATGCADTSAVFNVTGIGIKELESTLAVTVYPNPTNGLLYVDAEGTLNGTWTLVNNLGQTVQAGTLNHNLVIDMASHAEGMYYLKIEAESAVRIMKVLLAK